MSSLNPYQHTVRRRLTALITFGLSRNLYDSAQYAGMAKSSRHELYLREFATDPTLLHTGRHPVSESGLEFALREQCRCCSAWMATRPRKMLWVSTSKQQIREEHLQHPTTESGRVETCARRHQKRCAKTRASGYHIHTAEQARGRCAVS